jgi:hypothetical protein
MSNTATRIARLKRLDFYLQSVGATKRSLSARDVAHDSKAGVAISRMSPLKTISIRNAPTRTTMTAVGDARTGGAVDCHFVAWCQLPLEAQAAWVQAIGSILALGIAVLLPQWQRKQHLNDLADDADRQAHALAIELVPVLEVAASQLKDLEGRWFGASATDATMLVTEIREKGLDKVPELFQQVIYQLHILGKNGKILLKTCSRVRRISAITTKLNQQLKVEGRHLGLPEFDPKRYLPVLHKYLRDQRRDIEDALDSLVDTYDMRE